ncbi:NTP transferase domain-containing protein [Phaeacidiphilus oryzae]|uniref:NTP transferase domain-containing protein n=1 Tax=Phaeacidiphilus oryzae TaxID=348818 RepID=UPI000ADE01AE|nr:NTP transferase domain-containing protein [Phaeacidiphilus oryzae]
MDFDALILAGGAARRLGAGVDKPAVRVGGSPLLDRVLRATEAAVRTVVVGPPRPTVRPVEWTRERPPGGGPVAALAAGLPLVRAEAEAVLLLAADLPFLEPRTADALLGGLGRGRDAVLLVDGEGREQPLVAAYRVTALRSALAGAVADAAAKGSGGGGAPASGAGLPLRALLRRLDADRIGRLADESGAAYDCDTWPDIRNARARYESRGAIREHGGVLDDWIAAAKKELGIDLDVDVPGLLDMTKEVAHGVARPAAPLTAFLVGYAAARAGGGADQVARANAKIEALAAAWAERRGGDGQTGEGG